MSTQVVPCPRCGKDALVVWTADYCHDYGTYEYDHYVENDCGCPLTDDEMSEMEERAGNMATDAAQAGEGPDTVSARTETE